MLDTRAGIPAKLILEFTDSVWQHAQNSEAPLAQAIALPDHARSGELAAFAERLDTMAFDQRRRFTAAIDEVQVRSKLWLIDELAERHALAGITTVVLGAWYGILPLLLNWRLESPPSQMTCVDIDTEACDLGRRVVGRLYANVDYQVADAMVWDYATLAREPSAVLVNTICEHLHDAPAWWARVPAGQFVVLQSNNYDLCPDHVNWVHDLEEMKSQTPLGDLRFEGTLPLPIFDRFMLIGRR